MKINFTVFVFLFTLNIKHYSQQVNIPSRVKLQIENNAFFNFSFTLDQDKGIKINQGQNLLMNYELRLRSSFYYLGFSTGVFYDQSKDKKSNIRMRYTYFPLFISIKKRSINERISFRLKFGIPILSYFDSDYEYYENLFYNQMWPKKSTFTSYEDNPYYIRRKPFYILTYDMQWSVFKNAGFSLGATTYYSRSLFFYVNAGLFIDFYKNKKE